MRVWSLLLMAACAKSGEAGFQRGGTGVGEYRNFYFDTWEMDFGMSGPALPILLSRDNGATNLLKPRDPCMPSLAGVGLSPAVMAVGDAPGGQNSEFRVLLRGPAAVRVRTTYSMPYSCGGTMQNLTGSSTFTFFSNGRAIRTDENLVASQAMISSSTCTAMCTAGDPFHFTSFWAFAAGVVVNEQGVEEKPLVDKPACVIVGDTTIGVKYAGTRVQAGQINGGPTVLQDLAPEMQSWPGDLPPLTTQSQIVLRSGSDPANCARVLAVLNDPAVMVNGEVVPVVDGIHQATKQPYRGPTTITTPAALPDGFALEIDLGGATHARFLFNGQVSDYYLVELDGEHALFFLPPITSSDTLTIEPL